MTKIVDFNESLTLEFVLDMLRQGYDVLVKENNIPIVKFSPIKEENLTEKLASKEKK